VIVIVISLEWRELRELKHLDYWSKRFVKHYANAIRDHASEVIPSASTPVNNSQKWQLHPRHPLKELGALNCP
jgi:hypothetical protein